MFVKIVIVNFNTKNLLSNCLKSIYKKTYKHNFEVCVVDNNSFDGSAEFVKKNFQKVRLLKSEKNLGFAGGNNLVLKESDADYFLLLNSDTEVLETVLDDLIDFAEENNYEIATCKLKYPNGLLQPNVGDLPYGMSLISWISGMDDLPVFGKFFPSFHKKDKDYYSTSHSVGWVSGAVMLIKRNVIKKIGLLDEKLFMYAEDVDYCIRASKAGFRVGFFNKGEVIHIAGGSSKNPSYAQWLGEFKGLLYVYQKHFGKIYKYILKVSFYLFIIVRIVAYTFLLKFKTSFIYAKILVKI